jgi:hypothetical protein
VVSASDGHSADGCGSRKNSKEGAVVNHREKDIKKTWWKKDCCFSNEVASQEEFANLLLYLRDCA